jgi:hypothetical protein
VKTRRYCWRVGLAWEQEDGTVCQECGVPWGANKIRVYTCHARKWGGKPLHCTLLPGHEGPHRWEGV